MAPRKRRKAKKEKEQKKIEIKEVKENPISNKISFAVWFAQKVNKKELKVWQELEIKTFFIKDCGLKEIEDQEKYNETLKIY